jgi:hypothetical protein
MKGIWGLMEKAGLVQLSEVEKGTDSVAPEVQPAEIQLDLGAETPPPEVSAMISDAPPGLVVEETTLEHIFELAGVPPNPFPAERLLRLLDGLRAMDSGTRKMAVQAMDAADDAWSIEDPLADAQRKIAALDAYKRSLTAQLGQAEASTAQGIEDIKASLERATDEIRAQMAQLEQLLQREMTKAAEETARLEATLRATREAAAREALRMDKEIERLGEIPATFGQPGATN